MKTPLANLLIALTPEQRTTLASNSGTTVNYLYAMAGCHRERISATLAIAIEDTSTAMNAEFGTPIVTAREISTMCVLVGFDDAITQGA